MDSVRRRIPRLDAQVRGCEVPVATVESTLQQSYTANHLCWYNRRQAQNVRVAVHRHAVQREQVITHTATAHVHSRSTVRARGHPGQALRPTDRVAFTQR